MVFVAQTVLDIYESEAVGGGIFGRYLNFVNCQPDVVSDVISGLAVQLVGMDVCANSGDSRLKSSETSFSAVFRTSISSDRK